MKIKHVGLNSTVITIDGIKAGWEQWVLLRSDVHHDNPKCDQKLEKKHLDQAKEYNAIIIDNGDLFCAMQGKYDKRASKDADATRDDADGHNRQQYAIVLSTVKELFVLSRKVKGRSV